jgi:hypothetical protein
MTDEDSSHEALSHSFFGRGLQSVPVSSLAGQLMDCCPSFYSSLNQGELEALEKSNWLSSVTTVDKGVNRMRQGIFSSHPEVLKESLPFSNPSLAPECRLSQVPLPGRSLDFSASLGDSQNSLFTDKTTERLPALFTPLHSPSMPAGPILPTSLGIRVSEVEKRSVLTAIDSLDPTLKIISNAENIPIFQGKAKFIQDSQPGASSSNSVAVIEERDHVRSRGLGIDFSPLKTRSGRKKLAQGLPHFPATSDLPPDNGPLRALKALARSK